MSGDLGNKRDGQGWGEVGDGHPMEWWVSSRREPLADPVGSRRPGHRHTSPSKRTFRRPRLRLAGYGAWGTSGLGAGGRRAEGGGRRAEGGGNLIPIGRHRGTSPHHPPRFPLDPARPSSRSEERALRRDPVATGELRRTQAHLPGDAVSEPIPHQLRSRESQSIETVVVPSIIADRRFGGFGYH